MLIINLVHCLPRHGAKFTLSYIYCNSISTHEATTMPLPSLFKNFLRQYHMLHPSSMLAYIYPIFLVPVGYAKEGSSTLVIYEAKRLSYNIIDGQQGAMHVRLCPLDELTIG